MALREIIWDFWDIIRYILVFFVFKVCLFAITAYFFFLFQIKTSGFHLKEEGKELLGMLMAALANNNEYYACFLCLFQIINCYFQINWHQPKVLIALRLFDTCQILMLTKCVNFYLKFSCLLTKSVTNASKAIDTSPYSMHNALQTQCSLENMPFKLFNW